MYYWQRCIITEKTGFAFKYYWQVGYIPDKSDEMRVGLLTEFFWGRQVWWRPASVASVADGMGGDAESCLLPAHLPRPV